MSRVRLNDSLPILESSLFEVRTLVMPRSIFMEFSSSVRIQRNFGNLALSSSRIFLPNAIRPSMLKFFGLFAFPVNLSALESIAITFRSDNDVVLLCRALLSRFADKALGYGHNVTDT